MTQILYTCIQNNDYELWKRKFCVSVLYYYYFNTETFACNIMAKLPTVLIVEDDKMIRHMLSENLEKENFITLEASKGERCIDIVKQHHVDAILLDLGLPDAKDLEYIPAIRKYTNVPLIIVSGENRSDKRVKSIEYGADDFISKPFDCALLIAKVKAQLRRHQAIYISAEETLSSASENSYTKFAQWTLDKEKFQLYDTQNNSANLTFKEYIILTTLINNAGKTLEREELCKAISEENYIPSNRAIDVKVTRIRKKIGDNAAQPNIIKTVRGAGYIFNTEILNA